MGINKKITVCHLISGDLWAGAEAQAFTMLKTLSAYPDINLYVIVLNEGKLSERLRQIDISVKIIDESRYGFVSILKQITKYLESLQVDILHSHRYKENVLGGLLKRKKIVKYLIQTIHGINEHFTGIKNLRVKIYSALNKYFTNKYYDLILAVSEDIQRQISDIYSPDKIRTVHNAIDLKDIVASRSEKEIREELGFAPEDILIGSVGRMVPVKGFELLIEAADKIIKEIPEASFILAGDGPQLEELIQIAKEKGIGEKFAFLGFRDDPLNVINILDIFVISSYHEGLPTVVLEAMALDKAVVATNVGGVSEIIDDTVSGLLVPPGDSEVLAGACLKLLDDPQFKANIENNAKAVIEREYRSEVQGKRILSLYEKIVS